MRLFCFLVAGASTILAQSFTERVSLGVTGGVPLGRVTPGHSVDKEESRRYTLGPSVDLSLTGKWSVTVNPLYKRTGSTVAYPAYFFDPGPDSAVQFGNQPSRMRSHSLELPVIGKYQFGRDHSRWRPFVGTGFAFQTAWQEASNRYVTRAKDTGALTFFDNTFSRRTATDTGVILSTGLTFRRGPLQFSPEIRYTRWGSASPARNRHQADALLTIRFGGKR